MHARLVSHEDVGQPLDEPVWAALANRYDASPASLAARYPREIGPLAAVANFGRAPMEALASLFEVGERAVLVGVRDLDHSDRFEREFQARLAQMVLTRPVSLPEGDRPEVIALGDMDVAEMVDLAERTRPGPFESRTIELGRYVGIRADGALAAMAGERMRFGEFVEISAVCVDDRHRGKGFAAALTAHLACEIQKEGLVPFLHVLESNASAIALYDKLGFETRRTVTVSVLARK